MEAEIRKAGKVCLLATLDTKFKEADFLRREIEKLGHGVLMMDTGIKSSAQNADFPSSEVAKGFEEEIRRSKTREEASHYMSAGAGKLLKELYGRGEISAAVSLGGSGGCGLASAAMRALPLGVPKVIVTTMASGNTLPYVMGEDILLINPVVDIQNLNFMTEHALRQTASVLDALMKTKLRPGAGKTVAVTGFGVTTPCVDRCTKLLEDEGYEVLIFHARGISGGKIMEKMVREGYFAAVLDITMSEAADEICGGIYGVEGRMNAAVEMKIPYIVVPGALEMINLSTPDTLTPNQKKRVLYVHSKSSVKMRADASDMKRLAEMFAERLGRGGKTTKLIIPAKGFSSVNREGEVFFDPAADRVFIDEVKRLMPDGVEVAVKDMHINDAEFGDYLIKELNSLMKGAAAI